MPSEKNERGLFVLFRPAHALASGADVLAGYVVASPGRLDRAEAAVVVPFLFASAWLLSAAGSVFAVAFAAATSTAEARRHGGEPFPDDRSVSPCLRGGRAVPDSAGQEGLLAFFADGVARGRFTVKRAFLAGAALALAGIFAAMGAGVFAGRLPVYFAAFIFLANWARAGRASRAPAVGPASAGLARALSLGLGMSAHGEIVYLTDARPLAAAAAVFVLGAVVDALYDVCGEGGRRYLLLAALSGVGAAFAGAGVVFVRGPLSWMAALTGGAFVLARAAPAVRSLVPADIRRFAEGALLSGFFLASALCLARAEGDLAALALGGVCLALAVPASVSHRAAGPSGGGT